MGVVLVGSEELNKSNDELFPAHPCVVISPEVFDAGMTLLSSVTGVLQ